MNKKLFILPILLVAILSGCNLYLEEEEPVAEELKGYDKAEHIVNDTVDVTYQFQPNTRSITGSILDYLVRVEADTILYFLDNTPIDYLPVTGGYVFAEISDKLPWGLMSYVEWAGYDNGFYKVVTTFNGVALDDVFTVFEMEVNRPLDYSKGRPGPMIEGYDPDEHIPLNLEEVENPIEEIEDQFTMEEGEIKPYLPDWSESKAKKEDDKKEDDPDGGYDEPDQNEIGFVLDTRNITGDSDVLFQLVGLRYFPKCLKPFLGINKDKSKTLMGGKGMDLESLKNWYFAFSLSRQSEEKIHAKLSASDEIIEYWKDNTVTWNAMLEVGYFFTPAKGSVYTDKFLEGVTNTAKSIMSKIDKKQREKGICKWDIIIEPSQGWIIPLWGPTYLVLDCSVSFEINISACGKLTFSLSQKSREGYIYNNGTKTSIKDVGEWTPSVACGIFGSAEASGAVHVGVGLGIGRGVSLDFSFGPTFTGGVKAQVGYDFLTDDPANLSFGKNTYIEPYITGGLDGYLRARIFKKEFLSIPINFKTWDIYRETYSIYPSIDSKSIKVTKTSDDFQFDEDGKQDFNMQYKYDRVGILGKVFDYYPAIDLYEWKTNKYIDRYWPDEMYDYNSDKYIKKGETYHYDFRGLRDDVLYMAQPVLWERDKKYEDVLKDEGDRTWFTSASPYIWSVPDENGKGLRQIYVGDAYDSNGKTRVNYVAFGSYNVSGASKIKQWGLKLTLRNQNGKKVGKSQDVEVRDCKSKTYKIKLNIATTCRNFVTLEVTPWADVIDQKGDKSRAYYETEKATLVEAFKPTLDDLHDYNNCDWSLNPSGL